jgi:ABC-2 type transport system ATP-binding protein
MNHTIETQNLTRRFGKTEAVNNLSIRVPQGSVFAFLGPNGAGKTTTIKLLMNIIEPTAGSSTVMGVNSNQLGPREFRQIGYVAEDQKMPEWMTVGQFLDYVKPLYPTWDETFCRNLLKQFDLPSDRKLKHLSRGMRMKTVLVSSLAYRPRLLVLDEPFTGLDPLVRDELIRGILELTEQEQWTVFVSSHDIDEVERLTDWVGIIDAGHLRECESVESLQARFRQIQVAVADENEIPRKIPDHWLSFEKEGHAVRFVESRFDPSGGEAAIQSVWPGCASIGASPMSLREIFLALAKTYRFSAQETKR